MDPASSVYQNTPKHRDLELRKCPLRRLVMSCNEEIVIFLRNLCRKTTTIVQEAGMQNLRKREQYPLEFQAWFRDSRISSSSNDMTHYCLKRSLEFEIKIDLGTTAFAQPLIGLFSEKLEELKTQLWELLKTGFIRPSTLLYWAAAFLCKSKTGISACWMTNVAQIAWR